MHIQYGRFDMNHISLDYPVSNINKVIYNYINQLGRTSIQIKYLLN